MKRLTLGVALVLVLLMVLTAIAAAAPPDVCEPGSRHYNPEHPSCGDDPTTPPPPYEDCVFVEGVLEGWYGTDIRQCVWNVANPTETFSFQIQSLDSSVEIVKLPVLIVNEEAVIPSDKCFHSRGGNGPLPLPFPPPGDNVWTFSPADGEGERCDESPYLLTISMHPVKSGTVSLVMTPLEMNP